MRTGRLSKWVIGLSDERLLYAIIMVVGKDFSLWVVEALLKSSF